VAGEDGQVDVSESGDEEAGEVRRGELELRLDSEGEDVPFATWDPDVPEVNATEYSHLAQPLRVTLGQGDMLYLPAMW
jgi:peptidyl-lysine (3S)-dioxygenase / protease